MATKTLIETILEHKGPVLLEMQNKHCLKYVQVKVVKADLINQLSGAKAT